MNIMIKVGNGFSKHCRRKKRLRGKKALNLCLNILPCLSPENIKVKFHKETLGNIVLYAVHTLLRDQGIFQNSTVWL